MHIVNRQWHVLSILVTSIQQYQSVPVINLVASFTWKCQKEIPAIGREDFDGDGLEQIASLVDFPHVIKCHLEAPAAAYAPPANHSVHTYTYQRQRSLSVPLCTFEQQIMKYGSRRDKKQSTHMRLTRGLFVVLGMIGSCILYTNQHSISLTEYFKTIQHH